MITANVQVQIKHNVDLKKIKEELLKLDGAYTTVGFHEGAGEYPGGPDVVQVALWNEFGTSKSPERSYFRTAIDENMEKIDAWREEIILGIIDGKMTAHQGLELLGTRVMFLIQNKIKSDVPPPLAASTVKQKKAHGVAPVTLIDSTLMLRSVGFKVVLG